MATDPALILVGFGTGNGLQLTVEAESLLRRHGFAFSLNAPPTLVRFLASRQVDIEPLDHLLAGHEPWAELLLKVADVVLRQTRIERPVCLLLPDNPLFMNPLARFLVAESREQRAEPLVIPGISGFDVVVNHLGLDVGRLGLGVMDAARAIESWSQPATSPVLLFHLASLAETGDIERLAARLRSLYPPDHPVTLVNVSIGDGPTSRATAPLSRFDEIAAHIGPGGCLFIAPAPTG